MRQRRPKAYRRIMRHHPRNVIPGALFTLFIILLIASF